MFYRDWSLRCPQRFERQRVKSAATACRTCASTPRLQTKIVLARPSSDGGPHHRLHRRHASRQRADQKSAPLGERQDRPRGAGQGPRGEESGVTQHGRHGQSITSGGLAGAGRRGLHGLPRDAGRPREDAPPQGARRHHVRARQRRARSFCEGGGHQGHRSGGVEFICLRSYGSQRLGLRDLRREC